MYPYLGNNKKTTKTMSIIHKDRINKKLTKRQESILEYLCEYIDRHGYSPSLRDISSYFHIKSPKNVTKHLEALDRKGYISRTAGVARGIDVTGALRTTKDTVAVPMLGTVKAGVPHLAVESEDGEVVELDKRFFKCDNGFLLKVEGESMINAGIEEGDFVLVNKAKEALENDIVVALIDGEATVKRFSRRGNSIILKPENPEMEPIRIMGGDFSVLGVVVSIIKNI